MNDEDFIQRIDFVDDHIDELEMFFGIEYGDIEDFFSSDFNINDLTDDKTHQYLKVIKFYEKKLSQSIKAETYHSKNPDNNFSLKINEPQGRLMTYPNQEAGLGMVVIEDPKTKKENLRAVFPFITKGYEYPCSIRNIKTDNYGNEAEIEAFIDEEENLLINFYDIHYLDNRNYYNSKDTFIFTLMGFAHYIEVLENDDMISVEQEEGDFNERYKIYSVVKAVDKYSDNINGEKVFRITISLGYSPDGEDIPLDIYVTKRSLEGKLLPEVGDNLYAEVYIHGYLSRIEK